jgi:hypothetical protein
MNDQKKGFNYESEETKSPQCLVLNKSLLELCTLCFFSSKGSFL